MNTSGNLIAVAHWLRSHHQACHVLGAVVTVLLGMFFSLFHSASSLALPIFCDHWIRTGKKWPVSLSTVTAQRDAGGDSALLAEVAMHIIVSCPVLTLTSLPKSERRVGSALCLAQTMWDPGPQVRTCLGTSAACATREGRAGL